MENDLAEAMKHPPKIAQKFRHYKTVAIGVTALIVSTLLWVGWKNYYQSHHYLKTMGSCSQPTTIKIYDETGGIDPAGIQTFDQWGDYTYSSKPVNTLENKHFKNYVTAVSKYVFTKVDAMGLCQSASGKPQVDLVFVYRPAISRGITPFDFQPQKSPDMKQLDSPWIKLTLNKSPQLNLQAVFIWNERQFLLDQAEKMLERRSPEIKPLLPIDLDTFDRWSIDWYQTQLPSKSTNLIKQLPPDIKWLFGVWVMDGKSQREEAMDRLRKVTTEEKIGYIDLNQSLIDQLFASTKVEICYSSILDLKNIFNINKYRMEPYANDIEIDHYNSIHKERSKEERFPW
jgi:hypothetical protein